MPSVPLFTIYGDATPYALELTPIGAGNIALRIDGDFAGREVEEEMPLDALRLLAAEEPYEYDDLLGLGLKTDGTQVRGLIGVGSGNEPFILHRTDLATAVDAI